MKKNSKIGLNDKTKLKTIFATIGVAIIVFMTVIFESIIMEGKRISHNEASKKIAAAVDKKKVYKEYIRQYDIMMDSIRIELIGAVNDYIQTVAKRSKMTGEYIVDRCIVNDFDITLLMAQAHQETHFAKYNKRNNVFGINSKRYSHPNKAVDDYIDLMKSKYLITRTTEQLINSGFKVENGKGRYATSNYAPHIRKIRNKIINNTDIGTLFDEYQYLKSEQESLMLLFNDKYQRLDSVIRSI